MTLLAAVTDIERIPGSRRARRIWLDGEPFRTTSAAVIKALGLEVGDTVEAGRLAADCEAAERVAARDRAVGLLARHEFSAHQIAQRLSDDGYSEAVIQETVGRLVASGLMDDARFAAALVRNRVRAGYGRRAIHRDLERAGISKALAETALRVADDLDGGIDATAAARRLARPRDDVPRLAARLARRGFDFEESLAAARTVLGDAPSGGPEDDERRG